MGNEKKDGEKGKRGTRTAASAATPDGVKALKGGKTVEVDPGDEVGSSEGLGVGVETAPTKKAPPEFVINGRDIPALLPPGLKKWVENTGHGAKFIYDRQATMDAICHILATSSKSLNSICELEGAPSVQAVMKWLEQSPDLVEQYERARQLQADFLASSVPEIALFPLIGTRKKMKKNEDGTTSYEEVEVDNVERSRLIADAFKWYAGKLAPKKYGDKVADVTVNAAISVQGLLSKISGNNRSLLPETCVQDAEVVEK